MAKYNKHHVFNILHISLQPSACNEVCKTYEVCKSPSSFWHVYTQREISVLISQRLQLAQCRTRCNNRHLARHAPAPCQYTSPVPHQYCASMPPVLAQYNDFKLVGSFNKYIK